MPVTIDPSLFAGLPPLAQTIATVVAGLVIGLLVVANYVRSFKKAPEPEVKKDLVLQTASFADMGPVREVAKHLKTMAEEAKLQRLATEGILEVLTEKEKDDEVTRRVQLEVREALAGMRVAERPPARR